MGAVATPEVEALRTLFAGQEEAAYGNFDDTSYAKNLALYKSAMAASHAEAEAGRTWWDQENKTIQKGLGSSEAKVLSADLVKSMGAEGAAAMMQTLAQRGVVRGDLTKDWTPTNPVSSGLVPFDLEAPAKYLVPRYTPLRNRLPRAKGQGNARQYKRILSVSNSGQASPRLAPWFNSSTATSTWGGPGNLTLNRPQKIAYTGDSQSRAYVELGFSDQVNFKAQFQGLGFDNLRALSHTAILTTHLMGEEVGGILYGRGATGGGYLGVIAAPSGITVLETDADGTIPDATYFVYVRGYNGQGYTAVSTVVSEVVASGGDASLTITVGTEPAGVTSYELYVGTTTGIANAKFQTTFIGNSVKITSYNASGAVIAGTDTGTFVDGAYDGFYAVQSDPAQTGYFVRQNANWSTTTPGVEFETAFSTMWAANGATPDEIWLTGAGRTSFSQLLRIGPDTASSGYRTQVRVGDNSITAGALVTGVVNPNDGSIVDLNAHRFALPGTALLLSRSLDIPNSEVPAPVQMVNVQDYMALDWPVIQMTWDVSTYQMGTMIHYAPQFSGMIAGIKNG